MVNDPASKDLTISYAATRNVSRLMVSSVAFYVLECTMKSRLNYQMHSILFFHLPVQIPIDPFAFGLQKYCWTHSQPHFWSVYRKISFFLLKKRCWEREFVQQEQHFHWIYFFFQHGKLATTTRSAGDRDGPNLWS